MLVIPLEIYQQLNVIHCKFLWKCKKWLKAADVEHHWDSLKKKKRHKKNHSVPPGKPKWSKENHKIYSLHFIHFTHEILGPLRTFKFRMWGGREALLEAKPSVLLTLVTTREGREKLYTQNYLWMGNTSHLGRAVHRQLLEASWDRGIIMLKDAPAFQRVHCT